MGTRSSSIANSVNIMVHAPLVRPLGEASRRAETEPASGRASKLWLRTARVVDKGHSRSLWLQPALWRGRGGPCRPPFGPRQSNIKIMCTSRKASRRSLEEGEPEPASGRASKLWLPTARVVDIRYCGYSEPFGGAGDGHTGLRLGLASPRPAYTLV